MTWPTQFICCPRVGSGARKSETWGIYPRKEKDAVAAARKSAITKVIWRDDHLCHRAHRAPWPGRHNLSGTLTIGAHEHSDRVCSLEEGTKCGQKLLQLWRMARKLLAPLASSCKKGRKGPPCKKRGKLGRGPSNHVMERYEDTREILHSFPPPRKTDRHP